MDSCLCLVLDEAFWSGDKSAEGKLKGLTTSPTILIERKGREPYTQENLIRLVVIGNEEWLVPASADERRYAVFDVGENRMQDGAFFEKMRILCDTKGGAAILLDYFKKFDLSKVNVNHAPKTLGLRDQKLASLDTFELWLHDSLFRGRMEGADFEEEWPTEVPLSTLKTAFELYAREKRISSRLPPDRILGKKLKKYFPATKSFRKRENGPRLRVYSFPPLDEARIAWEKVIGHTIDWD